MRGAINFQDGTYTTNIEKVTRKINSSNKLKCDFVHYEGLFIDTANKLKLNLKNKKNSNR